MDTIPALLRAAAGRWGGKTALKSMREPPFSFATWDARADQFAKALIGDGMAPGERLGIWAPNMWEWVVAAVGTQRAGGAIVPLNPRLRAAEISDIVRRARVTRLVAVGDNPTMPRGEDMPNLRRLIVVRGDPELSWDAFLSFSDGVTDAALLERETAVTGDTVADILFTSGTTGRPKGAVFTHGRTVLSGHNMKNFASMSEEDSNCPLGPFAHLAGYKAGWVNSLVTGATVCWLDAHDSESVLNAIATMRVSVMPAPPIVWQEILDHPNRGDWDISSLRFAATGSTVIPPQIVHRLVTELKVQQVGTGYGLTESGGLTNFSRPDDPVEKIAHTAGRPGLGSEVRIVAPDGRTQPVGQSGEILVRSARTMLEYLDDAEATRAALDADRWLHTGDVGSVDEDGYLKVTDRLKDMFITNGFNVYPAELERLMNSIPGLAQCAVIGVPDPRKGEVGHAFLVRSPNSAITADEVIAWCKQNIANYKIPAGMTFVDDLPRNSLGKVLKVALKALI